MSEFQKPQLNPELPPPPDIDFEGPLPFAGKERLPQRRGSLSMKGLLPPEVKPAAEGLLERAEVLDSLLGDIDAQNAELGGGGVPSSLNIDPGKGYLASAYNKRNGSCLDLHAIVQVGGGEAFSVMGDRSNPGRFVIAIVNPVGTREERAEIVGIIEQDTDHEGFIIGRGRGGQEDLSKTVSRGIHAIVSINREGKLEIGDIGSTNGTRVFVAGEAQLGMEDGDRNDPGSSQETKKSAGNNAFLENVYYWAPSSDKVIAADGRYPTPSYINTR